MMPRLLHAGAWWAWALLLAVAATRTTNPLLLGLIVAVLAIVVAARRPETPWRRAFDYALLLGAAVIAIRVVFQAIFGGHLGSTVLITLPEIPLPDWLAGIRLGGPVTSEALVGALYDGMRLATVIACIGAATSLASPARLLRSAPTALYDMGVSLVVALSFAPQLIGDLERVRQARRLRGRRTGGIRGIAGSALPVFEGGLDRSVTLAAAMASRGYGRTAPSGPGRRRATAWLLSGALAAMVVGLYGLLDADSPPALGLPLVVLGIVGAAAGIVVAGRGSQRTRYRPDPWRAPEWLTVAVGAVAAGTMITASAVDPEAVAGLGPTLDWPALPLVPALAILVAAVPAVATPPVPAAAQAWVPDAQEVGV